MKVTWEEPRWDDLGWERLAAGVGRCRLPVWDCTVGLVTGPGGALLIDAGSSLAEGARLRLEAQELAGRRVDFLALTHPHFDHVFGAAAFAGAHVLAPRTRKARKVRRGIRASGARGVVRGRRTQRSGRPCGPGGGGHPGRSASARPGGSRRRGRTGRRPESPPEDGRPRPHPQRPGGRRTRRRRPPDRRLLRRPGRGVGRTPGGPRRRTVAVADSPRPRSSRWAARTRCTYPATARWWTRRSSGPNGTPWQARFGVS